METQNEVSSDNICPSRKRRLYDDGSEEPATKVLIEEPPYSLMTFCDEVLLEILKHLDANTLHAFGKTCLRFSRLITDHRLWRKIDLTSEELPHKKVQLHLKPMNQLTESISLRGLTGSYPQACWNDITLSSKLLKDISYNCKNLQVLELHYSFLDFESMTITNFPRSLRRLVFNNCFVRWPKTPHVFFTRIDTHFQYLEELFLEYCNWFETHDLVIFSKIALLKKLSLRGCMNLKECVPYGSIATRFGFKKLEYLDVRDTLISDSDLQCFNITLTLRELMLECPSGFRGDGSIDTTGMTEATSRRVPPSDNEMGEQIAPAADDANTVQIVIHNRSVINLRSPPADQNQDQPRSNFEVFIVNPEGAGAANQRAEGPLQLNRQMLRPNINSAIARSLWFERRYPPPFATPRSHPITDRGICGFGAPRHPVQEGVVWIRAEQRPPDHHIRKLIVRHYKLVTDVSLAHLIQCSPELNYLDLTGTSVTRKGIEKFKEQKPECYIISDFFTG